MSVISSKAFNHLKHQPKLYNMRLVVLFSVMFFLVSNLSLAQESKFSFEEQYNISVSADLEISTSDGDIQVFPGEEGVVKVFYIVHKGGNFLKITKEELEEHVIIEVKHGNNMLDISVKSRNNYNWRNQYDVSFEIYTPIQTLCDLKTSDGDIRLSGLNANQKCKTSDGDILIKKINGNVDLRTSDGDINGYGIIGDVEMETSDGDIDVEGLEGSIRIITSDGDISVKDAAGAISATTSDGDILAKDCSGSMIASTSDGDIRCNFLKITNELSFDTSDGDINITVPKGLGLNVKLKGETLKTSLSDFSGKTEEHHIEGKVNGGGIAVELITSDGTVILSYQ